MNKLKSFVKYLLSFFKETWEIDDYPLKLRLQENVPNAARYCYQVINWWVMVGLGETPEKAKENLKESFNNWVQKNGYKPRPGKKVPLQFATSKKLQGFGGTLDDFKERILGFKKGDPVFISDQSTLFDFTAGQSIKTYTEKIRNIYSIDISDIKDGNISKIIERLNKV